MDKFTREEAIGYMILALGKLGKSEKETREITSEIEDQMDKWTETVAEETHDEFYGI